MSTLTSARARQQGNRDTGGRYAPKIGCDQGDGTLAAQAWTFEDSLEIARTYLGQIADITGDPDRAGVPDDLVQDVAVAFPWGGGNEAEMAEVADRAWEKHAAMHRMEADEIRRDCQMAGHAQVGAVTVLPNPEFVCQSGPPEVRERQLRNWPASPHWWVTLTTPDGESETFTGQDLGSWGAVLSEARQAESDWRQRQEASHERLKADVARAHSAKLRAGDAMLKAEADLAAARRRLSDWPSTPG